MSKGLVEFIQVQRGGVDSGRGVNHIARYPLRQRGSGVDHLPVVGQYVAPILVIVSWYPRSTEKLGWVFLVGAPRCKLILPPICYLHPYPLRHLRWQHPVRRP